MAMLLGGIHWGPRIVVSARFTDATGLTDGAPVMVAGVSVGRVTGLTVREGQAVVTMAISPEAGLRSDMTAAIRSKTLLGERVVELLPGSPSAPLLQSGDTLTRTLPSTEPDDLMAGLAPFLSKVDPDDVAALAHAVGQAARSGQITRAVAALADLDTVLDKDGPKIARLVDDLDADAPLLDRTLTDADGTLERTPELMTHADRMLAHTDRLASALDTALATSSPHLVAQTELVLDRLPATLDRLDRLSDRLTELSDKAGPALDKASGLLNEPTVHRLLRDDGIRVHFGPF